MLLLAGCKWKCFTYRRGPLTQTHTPTLGSRTSCIHWYFITHRLELESVACFHIHQTHSSISNIWINSNTAVLFSSVLFFHQLLSRIVHYVQRRESLTLSTCHLVLGRKCALWCQSFFFLFRPPKNSQWEPLEWMKTAMSQGRKKKTNKTMSSKTPQHRRFDPHLVPVTCQSVLQQGVKPSIARGAQATTLCAAFQGVWLKEHWSLVKRGV